jgi:hypothetical protein
VTVGIIVYSYWDRQYVGVNTITNATTQDQVYRAFSDIFLIVSIAVVLVR